MDSARFESFQKLGSKDCCSLSSISSNRLSMSKIPPYRDQTALQFL